MQETDPQVVTVPLGQGSAPFNPRSQLLPVSPSASVSVPNGTFKSGKTSRTCILSLQVSVPYRVNSKGTKKKRKKKNAVESQSDATQEENGMIRDKRICRPFLLSDGKSSVHSPSITFGHPHPLPRMVSSFPAIPPPRSCVAS